jgi:hypothetical protein
MPQITRSDYADLNMEEKKYRFQKEMYDVIGACFDVHKTLGCGFLEGGYRETLGIEFKSRGIMNGRKNSKPFTKE